MEAAVEEMTRRRLAAACLTAAILVAAQFPQISPVVAQEAGGATGQAAFTPQQAAAILSAGDKAFRTGRVGDALRTFTTIFTVFPTWWIAGAKVAVASAQSGQTPDEIVAALKALVPMGPTGPWVPMLAVMAAASRLAQEDVEFIKHMSRQMLAEPPEDEAYLMRTRDADLRSRYALARGLALEAAGQPGMAVAEYRALSESRPGAIAPRVRLAVLLSAVGRHADADAILAPIEPVSLMPSRIRMLRQQIRARISPDPR